MRWFFKRLSMTKNYTEFPSEHLFELLQQDSPAAFEELYNRYWFPLFISAHKRLSCREDAEEAVQNLFESLWINRHKITIRTSLENYLFASIRYIVLRMIYNKSKQHFIQDEKLKDYLKADYSTEDTVLLHDLSRQIRELTEKLPEKCRKVFEMSRNEMMTNKEIAAILGISEKTVENHITKALHVIRNNMNHFFFLL